MSPAWVSDDAVARALDRLRPPGGRDRETHAAAVWSILTEPGDGVAGRLVAALGAAGALERVRASGALDRLHAVALDDVGIAPTELAAARARWLPRLEPSTIDRAFELARRREARLVVRGDDEWPARLDDLGDHAPHVLWVRGRLTGLGEAPSVALVGARASTGYGEHVAVELSSALAADGVAVVSGAAYGIDGAAHRGALSAGGRTVALLAGGVDRPYPAGHADLLARIAREGAVIAETPCGTAPSKWRFLARNRLIAALGDATVVVEAGARSGSLNTAAHAAELGRPLGAVPGPVTSAASAGCHRVLREYGAVCVTGVDDVRELVGLAASAPAIRAGRTDDLTRVLDAASTRVWRTVAELARRSGVDAPHVEALVGIASLAGDLVASADGWRRARSG